MIKLEKEHVLKSSGGDRGGYGLYNSVGVGYNYKVKDFNNQKQKISIEITDADNRVVGNLNDIDSDNLKSTIINDIKNRMRIK